MPDNTTKIISELDFETIRSALSAYISNNTNFTDYDFEGSGLSQLMNILAYNTHYNAVYLNMALNENFLDTAQLRSSVVSLAKQLGYTPKSKTSSIAELTFTITEPDALKENGNTIFLDKTYKFSSEKNGVTYIFSPLTTQSATSIDGVYTFSDIKVREGSYVTLSYTVNIGNQNEKFLIDNYNIDTSSIEVTVQESATNTLKTTYDLITDIKQLTPDSTIFYLFETADKKWQITFGDGVLGKKLVPGNIVSITYQTSRGSESNTCSSFNFVSTIDERFTNTDIIFTNIVPSYGGTEEELSNSIKYNAINNFKTQGRAVTTDDYKFFIERDYPLAESVSIWGGQDNDPPIYGKVFISFKPSTGFYLTNAEKKNILDNIIKTKNIVTVIPEIVDPEYTFIVVDSIVKFNKTITTLNSNDIKSIVRSRISTYNNEKLSKFANEFNYSDFITYIDDSDASIIGNITKISLRKNIPIILNKSLQYNIDFQNPIHPGSFANKYPFKASADLTLSSGTDSLYFDDDANGNIRIYKFSTQGVRIYLKLNAGTVNYNTGKVVLNNFYPSEINSDGTIDLICKPSDYSIGDISSKRNNLLVILDSDVTLDVRES